MARPKNNLNDKPSEYIEENLFKAEPEGLAPLSKCDAAQAIAVVKEMPKMKKVVFINGRDPGQELMFHYHSKTHPLKHYTLYHGKEVELCEEIIDHLENCGERQYGYRTGASGHPEMYVKGIKYLYRCQKVKD